MISWRAWESSQALVVTIMTTTFQFPRGSRQNVERILGNIKKSRVYDYEDYWEELIPTSHQEYHDRWLFAYLSIRSGWRQNVRGFKAIKKLRPGYSIEQLRQVIIANGLGMYHIRARAIWEFSHKFWKMPSLWYPTEDTDMRRFRNWATSELYGIGYAKTSFALEMANPLDCEAVCLDTHMLRLYGLANVSLGKRAYEAVEDHWLSACRKRNIPSPIARHIYWDDQQGRTSTRYWSHVLEKKKAA